MGDYKYVRCLYCLSGHELEIIRSIEKEHDAKCVTPMKIKRIRKSDGWEEREQSLLPGYIFVYHHEPIEIRELTKHSAAIRVLKYQQEDLEGYLTGVDLQFADLLLEYGGTIKPLDAVHVGQQVEIVDGLFKKLNGKVLKMDKRKQAALVELGVPGGTQLIWLSFEYLRDDVVP